MKGKTQSRIELHGHLDSSPKVLNSLPSTTPQSTVINVHRKFNVRTDLQDRMTPHIHQTSKQGRAGTTTLQNAARSTKLPSSHRIFRFESPERLIIEKV
jgi:hypothetical protein